MSQRFILVDDDSINNMICSHTIKKVFADADIISFENPLEGLKYILSEYTNQKQDPCILLLDINMPEMNGWDFLDEFAKMDTGIHGRFTTYIVSSSIDPADRKKAKENMFVKEYLEKPLKMEVIERMLDE